MILEVFVSVIDLWQHLKKMHILTQKTLGNVAEIISRCQRQEKNLFIDYNWGTIFLFHTEKPGT